MTEPLNPSTSASDDVARIPRQQSTVTVGNREVSVISEVILEPEPMIMTSVLADSVCLNKSHRVLPPAVVVDFQRRGVGALAAALNMAHLRFIRELLAVPNDGAAIKRTAIPVGIVATLTYSNDGQRVSSAGEDNVPADWLRASWLVAELASMVAATLQFGPVQRCHLAGRDVDLYLHRRDSGTVTAFTSGQGVRTLGRDTIWAYLEAL